LKRGRATSARRLYEQVLITDPESRKAYAGLYYAYTALGDAHAAAVSLARALMLQSIVTLPYRGIAEPVSILLLQSIQAGNALVQRLLDDRIFVTHVLLVEFYRQGTPLPPHDVVFNAIGDADIRAEALEASRAVLAQTDAPLLNAPQAVLATTRVGNANRFTGISGIRTARTICLPHSVIESSDAVSALAAHGLGFPLLLRAPGFHMGKHFVRVENSSGLRDAVAGLVEILGKTGSVLPDSGLLAIEFLDGRGQDGLFRKYRVLFVDGEMFPVHLAACEDWKIHYFSAQMAQHPERRAEDARFLAEMPAVLGSGVMRALAAIRDTLALDYAGIDFGVDRAGNLLLYEANANMAIIHPGPEAIWDYRRPAIERIYAAVHSMLLRRASLNENSAARRQESTPPAG
jgi:glutathione synthase/RimK-type ligase-like ATP-grasp enzyme